MKTLIIALNSKYIHGALAPWYLKNACDNQCGEVRVLEFTINDSLESILAAVYREKAMVAAFSCYIWNIVYVRKLAEDLKKVLPETMIVFGGPEVSFDPEEVLKHSHYVDYVLSGEGEASFPQLIKHLAGNGTDIKAIGGLTYRANGAILTNRPCMAGCSLDDIKSPYNDEMLSSLGGRIVYYEASRGCPFSCSYCLSSTTEGVRYFSMARVSEDLSRLINAGVKQIKFVDRTFNCNKARAKEIFKFILDNYRAYTEKSQGICSEDKRPGGFPNFHFEAAADLFDEEMLELLSEFPAGLVQFEIGIQTTNPYTLEAINRKTDIEKVRDNVLKLNKPGNIHLHLDLIAGLPHEDYPSFIKSFNDVYAMKPHQLQLGFLKMLKGSRVRAEAEAHGYRYREYPPYEVFCNNYISFDDMLELKGIEELVERYYNSGRFQRTLGFIVEKFFKSPFGFYSEFYRFCNDNGHLERPVSAREHYNILYDFTASIGYQKEDGRLLSTVNELMKFDYLSSDNTNNLPKALVRHITKDFHDRCFEFLKSEANIKKYLPEYEGTPAKKLFKHLHFEAFGYDITGKTEASGFEAANTVVVFDHSCKDPVTGLYRHITLSEDF